MIWGSDNCCFHNFLMDPCFCRLKTLSPTTTVPRLLPPFLSLSYMSEPSSSEQTEQGSDVDWAALKIAIDEMNAALTLVRANFITISALFVHKLKSPLPMPAVYRQLWFAQRGRCRSPLRHKLESARSPSGSPQGRKAHVVA